MATATAGDPIATTSEFKKVLVALRSEMTDQQIAMLEAHYRGGGDATATEMAKEVGYTTYRPNNLQYSALAHKIADALHYQPPLHRGKPRWWLTMSAGGTRETRADHFKLSMRRELVQALTELAWFRP